ncbi:MAG: hypothetical protein ACLGHL_05840 [Actinomycetota bacterium]
MKLRKASILALTALMAVSLLAPGIAEAKKKKTKGKSGPVVVGEDNAGDWGGNVDATLAPLGDALGMDLVGAEIGPGEKGHLNFVIKLNSLPALGGTPEIARYSWDFNVDGEAVELDGKFTNYSRGVCDPTAGSCPPPRDPGQQPFFIRGNCTVVEGTNVNTCQELGIVKATFDAAKATITIPVPAELINAKPGSKITGGTGLFGGSVEAAPAAFLTSGNFPADALVITTEYVVPKV